MDSILGAIWLLGVGHAIIEKELAFLGMLIVEPPVKSVAFVTTCILSAFGDVSCESRLEFLRRPVERTGKT